VRWTVVLVLLAACAQSKPAEDAADLPNGEAAEIRDARAKHEKELTPWGRWEDDARWIARWCPREPPPGEARFEAFRNYGHWKRKSQGPRWATARPGTWLETTTRTGWWTYRQASDEWCWVPGVIDAHIAWRTGLMYVGWAPVPPSGRLEDIPDRAWTYTMLGLLDDAWLTTLGGEARTDAMVATAVRTAKPNLGKPPSAEEVAAARNDLLTRAKESGTSSGNDLPPAQTLWALTVGKSAPKTATAPTSSGVPIGGPMQGMPGMDGMGALQNLLGDAGGLPPGMMPMMPPMH
jgi:hypothetical protein